MSTQDIRIVELKNWGWPVRVPENRRDSFTAFAYFDEILVHPVAQKEEGAPLQSAYEQMQEIFRLDYQTSQKPCIARQTIMAFTDIGISGVDCAYTPDEVEQFWAASDDVYFFMAMINVSPCAKLKTEVRRIRRLLRKYRGLLYLTYEYNELLLFFKGSSLREYAKLMMQISFGKHNQGVHECCNNDDGNCLLLDNGWEARGIARTAIPLFILAHTDSWLFGFTDICILKIFVYRLLRHEKISNFPLTTSFERTGKRPMMLSLLYIQRISKTLLTKLI